MTLDLPYPLVHDLESQANFERIVDINPLQAAKNLSDLPNKTTARTNLGLGSVATHAITDLLQAVNNLSDLASAATARTNLGIARGNASVTFSASALSGITTVSHGLSGTPTSVVATLNTSSDAQVYTPQIATLTATTFALRASCAASVSQTVTFFWIATL